MRIGKYSRRFKLYADERPTFPVRRLIGIAQNVNTIQTVFLFYVTIISCDAPTHVFLLEIFELGKIVEIFGVFFHLE